MVCPRIHFFFHTFFFVVVVVGRGGGVVSSSDKNTQCRHVRCGRPHQTEQTAITLATGLFALHFDTHLCVMWRLRPKPFKCGGDLWYVTSLLALAALLGFIIFYLQVNFIKRIINLTYLLIKHHERLCYCCSSHSSVCVCVCVFM